MKKVIVVITTAILISLGLAFLIAKPTKITTPSISFQFDNTTQETDYYLCYYFTKYFDDGKFFTVPSVCTTGKTDTNGLVLIEEKTIPLIFPHAFGTKLSYIEVRDHIPEDAQEKQCLRIGTFINQDKLPEIGPIGQDFLLNDLSPNKPVLIRCETEK